MSEKTAIILAGGLGARLKPYTAVLPKPLMPIGKYTILEIVIRQLVEQKFNKIIMAVNHQADLIKAFFGTGEKWGIKIEYSLETMPLSTMGPLKIMKDLPENFIVMNGDILTDFNISDLLEEHIQCEAIFTIACSHRVSKIDYGILEMNKDNQLVGFREKPSFEFDVSMGIYAVTRRILSYIPEGKAYGFDQLMLDLVKENKNLPQVKKHTGYWLDIGRPDDYEKALEEFESKKDLFLKNLQRDVGN